MYFTPMDIISPYSAAQIASQVQRSKGPGLGPWAYQHINNVRLKDTNRGTLVTFDYTGNDVEVAMHFEDRDEARAFKEELVLRVGYLKRRHYEHMSRIRRRDFRRRDFIENLGRPRRLSRTISNPSILMPGPANLQTRSDSNLRRARGLAMLRNALGHTSNQHAQRLRSASSAMINTHESNTHETKVETTD